MSADGLQGRLAVPLEGELVALEPLRAGHGDELWAAAQPDEIWAWLAHINASRERFAEWFATSLSATEADREGVFAVRHRESGELVGSSRFLNVRRPDRVVEIGWTWFNPAVWGSGVNVETKLLQMGHAFETLGAIRVELKTDARNERSRGAMAAIPAQFEGILRKHMTVPDIGVRDSAYYSVIDTEWPAVRTALRERLT